MSNITNKLNALRKLMQTHTLDYYYVPSTDAHNDEYVPECWQRRAFMSGFTGSAGDVLIGKDRAYLWTDTRYFLQAEQQLKGSEFQLMKQQQGMAPIHQWLAEQTDAKRIGFDPKLFSIHQAQVWQNSLDTIDAKLIAIEENLVDQIWKDQPAQIAYPIRLQSLDYAGESSEQKLQRLRQTMIKFQADHHVLTMLDAIAWLFNIRGQDISYNPLVISYAIISKNKACLFLNRDILTQADQDYFQHCKIDVAPYEAFAKALNALSGTVLLDDKTTSLWVAHQLKKATTHYAASPITLMKACKNKTEQAGMHEAHRRDAIAMVKFLHWLENHWQGQTEMSAQVYLEKLRREDPHCHDLSFATISGFADHGAIIHYSASKATNREITDQNLYLIDSGGQYYEGTTDITRTIHLGKPTAKQREHYTRVLKGHLALRHCIFPSGTTGEQIDAFAHQYLWQVGLDYGHGTGHGVGSNLCVHEGPQRISRAPTGIALLPGMIVSNEPGLYLAGQYGIRIENLCVICEKMPGFYGLDDLTKVPYATNLIETAMLTTDERHAINQYHREIYELLCDELSTETRNWLARATQKL